MLQFEQEIAMRTGNTTYRISTHLSVGLKDTTDVKQNLPDDRRRFSNHWMNI